MKLLCTGDLHLGAGSDYGREPGERLREQRLVWQTICLEAVQRNVDAVLFAGDAFERRRPTPAEIVAFREGLEILNDHDVRVYAIPGNHDVEAFERPTGLDVLDGLMQVHNQPGIFWRLPVSMNVDIAIAALPWTPVSNLVARNGGGNRDELNAIAAELLLDTARDLRSQIPPESPAILMLHWSVSGASLPAGLSTDHLREPVIPLAELESLGFDAIVCGHIHKAQLLATNPTEPNMPIFYTGSPMPLNFGEANVDHGVWILESHPIGTRGALSWTPEFVPIESRPFVTLDADDAGADLLRAIDLENVEGAIVKLRYHATAEQTRKIDHAHLRSALLDAGAHKVYAIEPTIERPQRARVEGLDEGLSPWEALSAYMEANSIDDDAAKVMYARTREYVQAVGS